MNTQVHREIVKTYSERQEVANGVAFARNNGGQNLGLLHGHNDGAVGEPGYLSRLERDLLRPDFELLGERLQDLRAGNGGLVFGRQRGRGEVETAGGYGAEAEVRPFENGGSLGCDG